MKLGKRIVILGVSACGKSTFSRALAKKTGLPLTHMDSIMWQPGWSYVGDEETVKRLVEIASGEEWIIEGYISKGARAFVLERADTLLYLDYASHISVWRYIRRCFAHHKTPRPELAGCPEKFSFTFLHRIWAKQEVQKLLPHLEQSSNQAKLVTFVHPRAAQRFLDAIQNP